MRSTLIVALLGSALVAQSPLTTTFASNNGQSGNMFDLVATNAQGVTVEYFDVNLDPGTFDLEVYVLATPGTWVGNEATAAAWTLVGSAQGVVSAGNNLPTLLPIAVCEYIPAGATQAFYVTVSSGTGINYTNGTTVGALYASNADLEYYEGCGKGYPFGSTFSAWCACPWPPRTRKPLPNWGR
ncbi:MAG: hypothetical protein AB8H80_23950 [Planctomycetota bacterium]